MLRGSIEGSEIANDNVDFCVQGLDAQTALATWEVQGSWAHRRSCRCDLASGNQQSCVPRVGSGVSAASFL